ncbi:peptide/nickel transport system permease protein [Sanguibacter gelidistatuariae]|uniref:Peptide/nickel transport system permease protein n=1 Tax=Sanguibacter gelidistatuariae TaxID=1814289 RepID=A0A1G6UV83_9MICO|nr:ABC transporter permease [Sanguibacter gelidistatuariae]SDD45300.1 peptide/nickel transport system permease protein [Sanguibacter gelidistatuariae]
MVTFLARRLLTGIAMLLVISALAFILLYLTGTDIARSLLGDNASAEAVALRASQLGLNDPLLSRYADWLGGALHGDLGTSWFGGAPVVDVLGSRLGVTLSLVVISTLISAVVATVLGVWAAVRRGWVDRMVQFVSLGGAAVPNYLIALGLVTLFAINLGWFAPTGYTRPEDSIGKWAASITLPVLALTIGCIAGTAQQVRSAMIDALRQDYVRTLRSRGLSHRSVVYKHVLRNAAGPGLSVLALQFVGLLGGAVIIEQMFAVPGLGSLSVSSTIQGDIPVIMGVVMVVAVIVIAVNLLIDIAHGWLNPKARVS